MAALRAVTVTVIGGVAVQAMAMAGSQKVVRLFRVEPRRTTVGSFVPSVVVRGSYLSFSDVVYDGLANGVGI